MTLLHIVSTWALLAFCAAALFCELVRPVRSQKEIDAANPWKELGNVDPQNTPIETGDIAS